MSAANANDTILRIMSTLMESGDLASEAFQEVLGFFVPKKHLSNVLASGFNFHVFAFIWLLVTFLRLERLQGQGFFFKISKVFLWIIQAVGWIAIFFWIRQQPILVLMFFVLREILNKQFEYVQTLPTVLPPAPAPVPPAQNQQLVITVEGPKTRDPTINEIRAILSSKLQLGDNDAFRLLEDLSDEYIDDESEKEN